MRTIILLGVTSIFGWNKVLASSEGCKKDITQIVTNLFPSDYKELNLVKNKDSIDDKDIAFLQKTIDGTNLTTKEQWIDFLKKLQMPSLNTYTGANTNVDELLSNIVAIDNTDTIVNNAGLITLSIMAEFGMNDSAEFSLQREYIFKRVLELAYFEDIMQLNPRLAEFLKIGTKKGLKKILVEFNDGTKLAIKEVPPYVSAFREIFLKIKPYHDRGTIVYSDRNFTRYVRGDSIYFVYQNEQPVGFVLGSLVTVDGKDAVFIGTSNLEDPFKSLVLNLAINNPYLFGGEFIVAKTNTSSNLKKIQIAYRQEDINARNFLGTMDINLSKKDFTDISDLIMRVSTDKNMRSVDLDAALRDMVSISPYSVPSNVKDIRVVSNEDFNIKVNSSIHTQNKAFIPYYVVNELLKNEKDRSSLLDYIVKNDLLGKEYFDLLKQLALLTKSDLRIYRYGKYESEVIQILTKLKVSIDHIPDYLKNLLNLKSNSYKSVVSEVSSNPINSNVDKPNASRNVQISDMDQSTRILFMIVAAVNIKNENERGPRFIEMMTNDPDKFKIIEEIASLIKSSNGIHESRGKIAPLLAKLIHPELVLASIHNLEQLLNNI